VAVVLAPEPVGAAACPAGGFVVTSRKGAPVRDIQVDLDAKKITIDGYAPDVVRVWRTGGQSHVRASFHGFRNRRTFTVSFRIDERACDSFRGRAAINRRLLRKAVGGRLPRGLRTRFTFTATRKQM
jgi:hypothetical protein